MSVKWLGLSNRCKEDIKMAPTLRGVPNQQQLRKIGKCHEALLGNLWPEFEHKFAHLWNFLLVFLWFQKTLYCRQEWFVSLVRKPWTWNPITNWIGHIQLPDSVSYEEELDESIFRECRRRRRATGAGKIWEAQFMAGAENPSSPPQFSGYATQLFSPERAMHIFDQASECVINRANWWKMSRVSEIVVCKGLRHLRHAGKHCQRAGDIRLKHLPLPAIDAKT